MISSAFTKLVQTKGIIMVKYSQCKEMAASKAAVDTKKPNHQIPVFFFCVSMDLFVFVSENKAIALF